MANKNNATANVNPVPDDDDIDAIPDSLDDEGTVQRSVPQTNAPSVSSGMGLEKLGAMGFDEERDEQVRKLLNPPRGDWTKSTRWKVTEVVYSGDCMPGDVNSDGRTVLIFSGELDARVVGDTEYDHVRGTIKVSPDLRFKPDSPTTPDLSSKLFNKAKDLYTSLHDERPRSIAQLVSMFEEDRFIVNVFNSDNGMIASDVKEPRAAQRRTRA